MPSERDTARRRWWQLRLWHLFAFVTLVAVVLWASQHLSFAVAYDPDGNSYIEIWWDEMSLIDTTPNHSTPQRVHGGVIYHQQSAEPPILSTADFLSMPRPTSTF